MADTFDDDDDDDFCKSMFDNGHWEWNDFKGCLRFISDAQPRVESESNRQFLVTIGPVEFKNDLDILEQQRFRKRFQKKPMADDVVTLQVSDEMNRRMFELHTKIRTDRSEEIEIMYRDNLEDLRNLVAKEYCSIIAGAGNLAKYHHMGVLKKSRSLTKKDRTLFESILRISTQIVWLALGRKSYNQIEIEIHRLFKSDLFNIIQHTQKSDYRHDLDSRQLSVLFGHSVGQARLLTAHSPVMEAVTSPDGDYRIMGLGVIQYKSLSPRLRFYEQVLIAPEEMLRDSNVSIGILGLPRNRFDTTLKEIKMPATPTSASTSTGAVRKNSQKSHTMTVSRHSRCSTSSRKSTQTQILLYPDIFIPEKDDVTESLPDCFPETDKLKKSSSNTQRKKWLMYALRLNKLHKKSRTPINE